MTTEQKRDGDAAEAIAASYLAKQGLSIVAKNVHNRFGEIDVIAMDGKTMVFVEVRFRRSNAYGGASASITRAKRERLRACANVYLSTLKRVPLCRFDAVLLGGLSENDVVWEKGIF